MQRHGLTPATGLLWGLGVGAVSGIGLAVAYCDYEQCSGGSEVSTIARGALGGAFMGGVVGGVAALSFHFSSRWRFRPATEVKLAPFARFPQGPPPGGFDALLRP